MKHEYHIYQLLSNFFIEDVTSCKHVWSYKVLGSGVEGLTIFSWITDFLSWLSSYISLHNYCVHCSSEFLCISCSWSRPVFVKYKNISVLWLTWFWLPYYSSQWVTLLVSLSLWQFLPLVKPWKEHQEQAITQCELQNIPVF